MTAPGVWSEEHRVEVSVKLIADYAAAVGEEPLALSAGAPAPPMLVAVYAAPAIWQTVLAAVRTTLAEPPEGLAGPLIHAAQEFEWYAPVRAGDRIATRARLDGEKVDGARRWLWFCSVSRNERRRLVCRGRWTILLPEGGL